MTEIKQFKPVRATGTTKESATQQALQMTGAEADQVQVEVIEEKEDSVTVRIAPLAREADAPAQEEPEASEASESVENESATESNFASESHLASAEASERACSAAQEMLDRMGLDAQARVDEMSESVGHLASSHPSEAEMIAKDSGSGLPRTFLEIEGDDVGILIGKHGQTLRAFQYLLNLTLNNSGNDEGVYVMVDAGNYRSRRAAALEKMARDGAERALSRHSAVRLEAMPGYERRLVHLLLQDDSDVYTASEGREPWRRVVVAPEGVKITPRNNNDSRGQRHSRGRGSRR